MFTDPYRALDLLEESLNAHMEAFAGLSRSRSALATKSERLTENTAFLFGQRAAKLDSGDRFIDAVLKFIRGGSVTLDPVVEPLTRFLQLQFQLSSHSLDTLNRLLSKTELVAREAQKTGQFAWGSNKQLLVDQIQSFRAAVRATITTLKKRAK